MELLKKAVFVSKLADLSKYVAGILLFLSKSIGLGIMTTYKVADINYMLIYRW